MSTILKKCEKTAFKLPLKERAVLAEHLISSLDDFDEQENERLWIEESERRYQEYKKGNISAKSADAVFRNAFKRLKR